MPRAKRRNVSSTGGCHRALVVRTTRAIAPACHGRRRHPAAASLESAVRSPHVNVTSGQIGGIRMRFDKLTTKYTQAVDDVVKAKEAELLEV